METTQHDRSSTFARYFKRWLGRRLVERPKPQPPAPPPKPSKHARLRAEHRHLHISADLRARATSRRQLAPIDPQLARIIAERRMGRHPRTQKPHPLPASCLKKCGVRDCAHAQPRALLRLRDEYAAANYDLAHRAADKQWQRNQHLEREIVPCVYHNTAEPKKCRCRGRREYLCQPDLEHLAYIGLLDAILYFDKDKAGCLSSYAVHKMKFSMLTLLRQTPVYYPPDLLRDRRDVGALRKTLCREPTEAEMVVKLAERGACTAERARLAMNCYYGNERKSVEELHEQYFGRTSREDRRARRSRGETFVENLSIEQPRRGEDSDGDVIEAIASLPAELRADAQRALGGRSKLSDATLGALREALL